MTIRILAVEDDIGDFKTLKRTLLSCGLPTETDHAVDMLAALEYLEKKQYDIIFLDFGLPLMNGLHALSELTLIEPPTPIVMVTGQGDETLARKALKSGASDYIPKREVTSETLRRTIDHVLEMTVLQRKLEEQQRSLESFAYVLAHDLKTPINQTRLIGEMLSDAIKSKDYSEAENLSNFLVESTQRMDDLISVLSSYNQAQSEDVVFQTFTLSTAVSDAMKNLDSELQKRGAKVTFAKDLPVITASPPMITQLLQNLIGNGIKYCDAALPRVHVFAEADQDGVNVMVQDNGIGIAEEDSLKVFQPFQRLRAASKFEGTGLGLATCQAIIQRHEGRIWVTSKPGEGSIFSFWLPRHSTEKTA